MADKMDTLRFKLLGVVLLVVGALLSVAWWMRLSSFRQLHEGKFKVIADLEALLIARPYEDEWKHLGSGRSSRRYRPLTQVESFVPWIFLGAYVAAGVLLILVA